VPERAAESGGPSPQDQIRAVLDAYAAAYTRMDVAGVVRLQPSLNRAVLQRSFDSMKAFSVQLRNVQITVTSPTTAVVTCIWDSVFDGKVGGRQRQAPPTTISLQKTGNQWVITDRR
jgi:hypothetical protein